MTNVNPDFKSWLKTPRLDSPFLITEKIDGTNCGIFIELLDPSDDIEGWMTIGCDLENNTYYKIIAQSRNRLINLKDDNYGFAQWVFAKANELCSILGPGRHYGEWWGGGIQRGYGLAKDDKRFSLFNVNRYNPTDSYETLVSYQDAVFPLWPTLPQMSVVPVLEWWNDDCDLSTMAYMVDNTLGTLEDTGSHAVHGFEKPEGVVLYHKRADQIFKKYVDPSEKKLEVGKR